MQTAKSGSLPDYKMLLQEDVHHDQVDLSFWCRPQNKAKKGSAFRKQDLIDLGPFNVSPMGLGISLPFPNHVDASSVHLYWSLVAFGCRYSMGPRVQSLSQSPSSSSLVYNALHYWLTCRDLGMGQQAFVVGSTESHISATLELQALDTCSLLLGDSGFVFSSLCH